MDTLHFPHDTDANYIHQIDETVTRGAVDYIRQEGPDLSWVYLEYTDDMGHRYGDSEPFYRAVRLMDDQMGRIWKAVQYRQKAFGEDWQVFITTDHGRTADTGKNHGGQSDRERTTWLVTNARGLNSYFRTGVPGIVDIMPTLARHLQISIPKAQAFELDGVPLTGKLSITRPVVRKDGNRIALSWTPMATDGTVRIWLTTTNRFKEGGQDRYLLMDEVPVKAGQARLDVAGLPASFYKIVLEGRYNTLNRWITEEKSP